jgi:serine/threonine protein phosphatase 1
LRLYVIGDVHGRFDLLTELEQRIKSDLATAPAQVLTIFLGDYIDRGPNSAAVIERLSAGDFATPIRALRGNHEEMLLKFLADASVLDLWRKFGGLETLHSYDVSVADPMRGTGFERAQIQLRSALPLGHRRFLENTEISFSVGDYLFCHAGVRPGIALDQQKTDDLLWIREDFLQFGGFLGKVVVHGHTPVTNPEVRANRINIDTGAYATSILTALILEGAERRFLMTGPAAARRS